MESMLGGEIMSSFFLTPLEKRRCRPSHARNADIFQASELPTEEHHKKACGKY